MTFLILTVIFNFNISVYFNHYDFIAIIICKVGSHSTHFECTYADVSLHFLAACLVLRADDGLVNSSVTCSPFIWLRIQIVFDPNFIIYPRLSIAVGKDDRPAALSSGENPVFITTGFLNVSCLLILLSVLRHVHSLFQCEDELLFSLRPSSSCLRLLLPLLVPSIFPSKTCFRTQFSRKITFYIWRKKAVVVHVTTDTTAF